MGKSPRPGASANTGGKRHHQDAPDGQSGSKAFLANNRYAILENGAEPKTEKKEKVPPFFIKGFPAGLREQIYFYIGKGLKCTIRMCTDGYKLMVPAMNHYKAVEALLQQKNIEYFSHDIEANKPLKVVLRGLPDMKNDELSEELKANGLKPVQIHKMNRHDVTRKYRDQLYLVHIERNTTCLKDLQNVRALFHIVVKWERYKPVHRDVTQCSNCLMFGHGTKNCHMVSRCIKCGKTHVPGACVLLDEADPVCANCGADHEATNKNCPKRAEFIAIRKRASTQNQPGHKKPPVVNVLNFPAIPKPRPIPLLPPLVPNNRLAAAAAAASAMSTAGNPNPPPNSRDQAKPEAAASTHPPGLSGNRHGSPPCTFGSPVDDTPFSAEVLVLLVSETFIILQTCRTRTEQIQAVTSLLTKYGP